VRLARAKQFQARRPSQRSAPAHRNLACWCRRVCAHANSARKETYTDCVLLARYEVRRQHLRQSESSVDIRRSHVRHDVHQRVSACRRYQRPTPVACQRGVRTKPRFVRGSVARRPGSMESEGTATPFPRRIRRFLKPLGQRSLVQRRFPGFLNGVCDGNRALFRDAASRAD
jgi:hypothetical protein